MLALKMGGLQQKTNTGTFDGDSEFVTQTTRPVESKSGGLVNGKKLLATEFIHDKLNLIHNLNPEGASWIYIKIKTFNYNIIVLFFSNTLFFFVTILIICWSLLSLDKVLNSCFSHTLLTQNKKKKNFKTITVHLSYRQFKIFTWNVLFIECQMDPVSHCFLSDKTDLINPLP